eukprot:s1701_g4.t2
MSLIVLQTVGEVEKLALVKYRKGAQYGVVPCWIWQVNFSPELEAEVRRTFPSPTSLRRNNTVDGGSQVDRYGGNEAASIEDMHAVNDPAADTAANFMGREAPRNVSQRKSMLPGSRPWNAFKRGTQIIVLLWTASVIWAVVKSVLNIHDAWKSEKEAALRDTPQHLVEVAHFFTPSLCAGLQQELQRRSHVLPWSSWTQANLESPVLDAGCGWETAEDVSLTCDATSCTAGVLQRGGRNVTLCTAIPRGGKLTLTPLGLSWTLTTPVVVVEPLCSDICPSDVIFTVVEKGLPQDIDLPPGLILGVEGEEPDELEPKKCSKEEESQGDRELAGGLVQFFYEFKNAVNLCVLFRNRALATNARVTWGDFGKARVVGFPPARQMEMEGNSVLSLAQARREDGKELWRGDDEPTKQVLGGKSSVEGLRSGASPLRNLALQLQGESLHIYARTHQDGLLLLRPRGEQLRPVLEVETSKERGSWTPESLLVLKDVLFSFRPEDASCEGAGLLTAWQLDSGVKFQRVLGTEAALNMTFCSPSVVASF